MKTLVEDEEPKRLRAMAEGTKPFERSGLWERLAAKDWSEIKRLPARERLGIGYYTAAQRRAEMLKVRVIIYLTHPEQERIMSDYPLTYNERNEELDEEERTELMEFRLVYQGPLPGSGNDKRRTHEKHYIRKQIHKQLADLWKHHPLLTSLPNRYTREPDGLALSVAERITIHKHGFEFIPLVNERYGQVCDLDILLLRRERPGNLITQSGDIDNRIKTLFDALTVPEDSASGLTPPEPDEAPFYCLLGNDKLVTRVSVTADRLLTPREETEPQTYVHAIIHAKVSAIASMMWGNILFREP